MEAGPLREIVDDRPVFDYRSTPPEKIRDYVLKHGCYSPEENQKIYVEWFSTGPRYLFRAVDRKYFFTSKKLSDVGCAFGTNLLYCNTGSYGVEIDEYRATFARHLGLQVYCLDAMKDNMTELPQAEAIWCSSVLEHVESPYVFLQNLLSLLQPGGLLAISVPTIPAIRCAERLPFFGRYMRGYCNPHHLYAFVPATLQFVCEKAGFETIEVSSFLPGALGALNHILSFKRLVGRIVYVGERPGT